MADFLRLRGAQIALDTIGDEHINPSAPISEANLSLAYGTSALNTAIGNLSGKKFLTMIAINGTLTSGTGSSIDASTAILAASPSDTPGGSDSQAGIVTASPNNKVQIRATATGQPIEHAVGGPDVYGRLTESGGVYTLSFKYEDSGGVEQTHTFGSDTAIDILFPESFALSDIPFNALVNGVSFVDGLPASHTHAVADITDFDPADYVTLTGLAADAGAALVGYDNTTSGLAATDVQAAIDELEGLLGSGIPTFVTGQDLTAQVGDGDPAIFTVTAAKFTAGSLAVFVNGSRQTRGIQFAETTPASGIFTFDAGCVPVSGDSVTVDYSYLA